MKAEFSLSYRWYADFIILETIAKHFRHSGVLQISHWILVGVSHGHQNNHEDYVKADVLNLKMKNEKLYSKKTANSVHTVRAYFHPDMT